MSKTSDRRANIANRMTNAIVEELFVNGNGEYADRLVLMNALDRDIGGLCKRAVVQRVQRIIKAGLKAEGL